jgi:hypothetical protein
MTEPTPEQMRFNELLPFYINGTVGEADRQWMEDYATNNPEASLWLRFDENIRTAIQSTTPPTPENIRIERFLNDFRRIGATRSPWRRFLDSFFKPRLVPMPALALVALVVAVQGLLLTGHFSSNPGEEMVYRSTTMRCDKGQRIRVVFKPEVTHGEVTILLRKVEGSLTDGPTETGELWITVPPGHSIDEAYVMLKSSILVDDALITIGADAKCP